MPRNSVTTDELHRFFTEQREALLASTNTTSEDVGTDIVRSFRLGMKSGGEAILNALQELYMSPEPQQEEEQPDPRAAFRKKLHKAAVAKFDAGHGGEQS